MKHTHEKARCPVCGIMATPQRNARLIAAAPELLAALEQVARASEDCGDMEDIDWTGLRAAIAKATGE